MQAGVTMSAQCKSHSAVYSRSCVLFWSEDPGPNLVALAEYCRAARAIPAVVVAIRLRSHIVVQELFTSCSLSRRLLPRDFHAELVKVIYHADDVHVVPISFRIIAQVAAARPTGVANASLASNQR